MLLKELRVEVLDTYRKMLADGVIRGTQGNVSAFDKETGLLAITPSGVTCDRMDPSDIAVIDFQGKLVEGNCKPTSETPMHTCMYRANPELGAIVHSHAPYSTVFAIIHTPIPVVTIESAGAIGCAVRVAPFRIPGTEELGQAAIETMGSDPAVLLANHGLLTVGKNLALAYEVTIACENTARLVIMAQSMNAELVPLDEDFSKNFHELYAAWFLSKHA